MKNQPDRIFYGKRDAVIREVGGLTHIYPGKYLIQPDGNATYDADAAGSAEDLKALIKEYRALYPDAEFIQL